MVTTRLPGEGAPQCVLEALPSALFADHSSWGCSHLHGILEAPLFCGLLWPYGEDSLSPLFTASWWVPAVVHSTWLDRWPGLPWGRSSS